MSPRFEDGWRAGIGEDVPLLEAPKRLRDLHIKWPLRVDGTEI